MNEREIAALIAATERRVNYSRPDLRDDVRQEGWVSALQALSTYEPSLGYSRRSWIILHARRDMVRYLEREANHGGLDDISELLDQDDIDELIDYDAQLQVEARVDVFNMLSAMPEPERRMVIAHIFDDLSYSEIAERNSLNKQAVYRIVTTGMRILKEKFS